VSELELLLRTEAGRVRAPEALRARVLERAAGAREPRFALPRPRRVLLVAAPVAAAGVAAAALVNGFVGSGSPPARRGAVAAGTSTAPSVVAPSRGLPVAPAEGEFGAGRAVVPAPGGRLTDYRATLRVRVRDLDRLTDATSEAVRIAQSLHGYAASVNTTTGNGPGVSYLELRVPASRVQEALLRLSGLGTVLSQQLSQQDLEGVVAAQNARIASLRRTIRKLRAALAEPGLAADVRVRLELALDDARRALTSARKAKAGTLREGATAKISLQLTTERSAVAPPTRSRFDRSIDDALGFLGGVGAVGLAVLIGASPFLLLAGLAVAGRRAWRRREEQRLLAVQ
jgi:uncharacterized protein DUF4349